MTYPVMQLKHHNYKRKTKQWSAYNVHPFLICYNRTEFRTYSVM